jgi:hypothetical protein
MADDGSTGDGSGQDGEGKFDLVVGKSTDKFYLWQQVPAWVLGGAAIVGGGVLIALPKHQTPNAWAAVIIGLFLAGLLSYRSAFTLNDGPSPGSEDPSPSGKPDQDAKDQDAKHGAGAGPTGPAATTKPHVDADSGSGAGSRDPAPGTKPSLGDGDDEPTSSASAAHDAEPGAPS